MRFLTIILVLSVFTLGFGVGGMLAANLPTSEPILDTHTVVHRGLVSEEVHAQPEEEEVLSAQASTPDFGLPPEQASPKDRIMESAIDMRQDGVFINIQDPQWAVFADTNSMDPVFDSGHHAIQIVPRSTDEIEVGDIISYDSPMGFSVIHRVKRIGQDNDGWYCIVQGDNNPAPDPIKVRFNQITRVVVAVIY